MRQGKAVRHEPTVTLPEHVVEFEREPGAEPLWARLSASELAEFVAVVRLRLLAADEAGVDIRDLAVLPVEGDGSVSLPGVWLAGYAQGLVEWATWLGVYE